jgi:hypothetical protein
VADLDRVVEDECLVAGAPVVADASVAVDDEVGDAELVQTSSEVETCLT